MMQTRTEHARIGVDIGGTFTDVALEYAGKLTSTKVLTDYTVPEAAIIAGVHAVVHKAGITLAQVGTIIHGTTLATNALIERRGAKTAFVTTRGFRDVIEMRTENRFELYDLNIVIPPALIPRRDRFALTERINAQGAVLQPLQEDEIILLAQRLDAGGYDSVAIGFLHAYVNDAHERQVRDTLARLLPQVALSISSEVSPQMREFQRFNTVCANAYVKPLMASYLNRLVAKLQEAGAHCPVFMIHSGGGIITVESAAAFPVRLLESGPAGGAIFAAHVARQYGLDKVLSYDMGGTTAKICLIEDQVPKTAKTFEVARTYRFKKGSGMPISIPVIEMIEIGAGGGSIASVDVMQQIRVGPHSAGSEPGPACYARGGDKPTVTDADLLLGRLDAHDFAGGSMPLSVDAAQAALRTQVADALRMDAQTAAFGLCEVVDENMANAARMHAVENGKELSDYTMIAFGGAAPLHACRLCEKLGIRTLIIPPGAGVGSAIGFLRAPVSFEAVRSAYLRLNRFDTARIQAVVADLSEESIRFVRAADPQAQVQTSLFAYMRYVGQGWEIPVELPVRDDGAYDADSIREQFDQAYAAFFGRAVQGLDAEIISWSMRASSVLDAVPREGMIDGKAAVPAAVQRDVFDAKRGAYVSAAVLKRDQIPVGGLASGPSVITETETTTVISSDYEAVMQANGCLLIRMKTNAGVSA